MILDAQNLLSDAQAVTATAESTNVIDLGTNRNVGTGEPIYVVCQVDTAFTDASSNSTVAVTVSGSDTLSGSALSSGSTLQTLGTFAALTAAGSRLVGRLQPDVMTKRYIALTYTVANGDLTTGAFTAFLTKDIQAYTSYADAITIS